LLTSFALKNSKITKKSNLVLKNPLKIHIVGKNLKTSEENRVKINPQSRI